MKKRRPHINQILFILLILSNHAFGQSSEYDLLIKKGVTLVDQNKLSLSRPFFEDALQIDSNRVEANYWLACYYSNACIEKTSYCVIGLRYLNKVISINKSYRKAFKQRALIKIRLNDYKGTIYDLNQAAILNPIDTDIYTDRAIAKYKLKDKKGACADLSKAIQLGSIIAKGSYSYYCK